MTLTAFEWTLITAGVAMLIAVIAYLLVDKIKRVESDHKTEKIARESSIKDEATAREAGDSKLTAALAEITASLREISENNVREHGEFANRRDVGISHERIYRELNEIKNLCVGIENSMVTQDQCRERCAVNA